MAEEPDQPGAEGTKQSHAVGPGGRRARAAAADPPAPAETPEEAQQGDDEQPSAAPGSVDEYGRPANAALPVDQVVRDAPGLLGESRAVARAALSGLDKDEVTVDEAKGRVADFLERVVETDPDRGLPR